MTERRKDNRWAFNVPLRIRFPGGVSRQARFIDLSARGCRLQSLAVAHTGQQIFLQIGGLSPIGGTIVWAKEMFTGVEFAVPLSETVLDHLLKHEMTLSEQDVEEMRQIAERCAAILERRGCQESSAELALLSRDCLVQAAITNLNLRL